MKFGLIGIGKFGKHYIRNLQEIGGAELVVCGSRTIESFNALPEDLKVGPSWTNKMDDIINLVDTVIIATHPDSHFQYAEAALSAGKHVICEKPCMFSEAQYEKIRLLSQVKGGCFFTNYLNAYSSVYPKIHESIQKNDFSVLNLVNIGNGPQRAYSSLWDYGSHDIAFAYTANACQQGKVKSFKGVNDRFNITLEFPKSEANITVGSGFPERINSKECVNSSETISWLDKREEPLLKRVLSSFVELPVSNLHISIEVSRIISQL
jgi:predicted dehydrogenase